MSSSSPTKAAVPPARKTPRSWRSRLARAAFLFAALITVIVGYYVVERVRSEAAWKDYQARAQIRGVKLTIAEYVPPPVPDDRNFAAIPLFTDAFKPKPPQSPLFDLMGQTGMPPLGSPMEGQAIDLDKWQAYFLKKKWLTEKSDQPAADVLKALDRFAPQLEQLRIAGQRPEARFPINYEAGAWAPFPHLGIVHNAVRLYALRLAAHLGMGDSPAAYEDFRAALRLYTALDKEPTLVTGLVRLSLLAMLENVVTGGLIQRQWHDAELEKITADLGRLHPMEGWLLSLGSERAFDNWMYEVNLGGKAQELAELMFGGQGFYGNTDQGWSQRASKILPTIYPRGWVRLSQLRTNRYFDQMSARISLDPPRVSLDLPGPEMLQPFQAYGVLDRMRYLLFLTMAPALQRVERQHAYAQTSLDETRLACALERYRLAHQSLPDTLEALAPTYLAELPRDVMTGEPLHFRPDGHGGYILYAVGWNLKDDGGHYENDKRTATQDQLDWVWTVPAP